MISAASSPGDHVAVNPFCLDCIRDGVEDPEPKNAGSSYCSHHVYMRTKASRHKSELKTIVALLSTDSEKNQQAAINMLQKTDSHGQYRISHALTFEFAGAAEKSCEGLVDLGLAYEKGDPELHRIRQKIEDQRTLAYILRERKLPDEKAKVEIHSRSHPHYERDLEELSTADKYKSTTSPARVWGPE